MARKPPVQGDLIKVEWLDIYEDPTGNPEHAKYYTRASYGIFWAQDSDKLVTTTTIDPDGPQNSGWCCYPVGTVKSIQVIKRHK